MWGRRPVGDTRSSTSRGSPPPTPAGKTQQSTSLVDPPLQPANHGRGGKQLSPSLIRLTLRFMMTQKIKRLNWRLNTKELGWSFGKMAAKYIKMFQNATIQQFLALHWKYPLTNSRKVDRTTPQVDCDIYAHTPFHWNSARGTLNANCIYIVFTEGRVKKLKWFLWS